MSKIIKTNNNTFNGVASLIDELFSNETFGTQKTHFSTKSPFVNIKETEDDFTLEFSIPGINKEEVNIELDNEKLTVSAELENNTENTGSYSRREFHISGFSRSFILPDTIDATKINASHNNGILTVSIPKKEESKPKPVRTITINK